jgi:nicotinamide mononucleotide transporter
MDTLWVQVFALWGSPVTLAEVIAFALSLAMVERNIRVKASAWPLAIAASVLYGLLFHRSGLYGEATLQAIFVAVSLWGWWQWARGRTTDGNLLSVRHLSRKGYVTTISSVVVAWPVLGALLERHTDSTVPYVDALATVASIAGQVLLGRKFVDNWPVWIAVNVFSVGLFAHKQLWLTALLYAIFAALSVVGWRAWILRAHQGMHQGMHHGVHHDARAHPSARPSVHQSAREPA